MTGPYRDPTANELHEYIKKLEAELSQQKRRAEAAEADNIRARDLIESYGVPRQRAESVSRAIDVLVTRVDRERDDLRRENANLREVLASLHVKIALPLHDDVADRKAMMAEIDAFLARHKENSHE